MGKYIVISSMLTHKRWWEFWKPKYDIKRSAPMDYKEAVKFLDVESQYISYVMEKQL